MAAPHPEREGLGPPRASAPAATARPPLHRSPPRPRGHQPAGLRRHPPVRAGRSGAPTSPIATADHNVPTEDIDKPVADPISAKQLEVLEANTAEFGITHYGMGDPQPGHRPRDRPRAGPHPAGHDHRVRRQPHLHPRGLRRPGLRHRHQRGRARARHPDAPAGAPRHDGRHRRGRAARRAPRPRTSSSPSSASIGTGGGIGSIIEYRGSAIRGPLDGGPDDGLQHVDRGRRQGRAHRPRRRSPSST